jgi:hypothetical protein
MSQPVGNKLKFSMDNVKAKEEDEEKWWSTVVMKDVVLVDRGAG